MRKSNIGRENHHRSGRNHDVFSSMFYSMAQLKKIVAVMFKDQQSRLFITNVASERLVDERHYCLIFEKESIEIIFRSDVSRWECRLDLKKWEFFINNENKPLNELDQLIEKIQWVLHELEAYRATAYIESYKEVKGEL